jgi:cardiolipin synthase
MSKNFLRLLLSLSVLVFSLGVTGCAISQANTNTTPHHHSKKKKHHSKKKHSSKATKSGNKATKSSKPATHHPVKTSNPISSGGLSLITMPGNGVTQLENAVSHAHSRVLLTMYELEDKTFEADLVAAHRRGVYVRVLLNGGYYGEGFPQNVPAYDYLKSQGVAVKYTPKNYALTHEKSLVIDQKLYLLTFNFTSQYYATSRDLGIVDSQAKDVSSVVYVFNRDWAGIKWEEPTTGVDLLWSPGAEDETINLINSAHHSLDVYNEEMEFPDVVSALASAAKRGVDVRIVMTADSEWDSNFNILSKAGAHIHLFPVSDTGLYIHAKLIIEDNHRIFLGSQNFSTTSLERNRELGIVFTNPAIEASLLHTFNGDYAHSPNFAN